MIYSNGKKSVWIYKSRNFTKNFEFNRYEKKIKNNFFKLKAEMLTWHCLRFILFCQKGLLWCSLLPHSCPKFFSSNFYVKGFLSLNDFFLVMNSWILKHNIKD